jgi:phosphatidylglycerophosphate synthase
VFQRLATFLAKRGVSPNAISMAGMIFAALAALMLAATSGIAVPNRWLFAGAAGLIQLRLLCNLLDGLVAIEGGRRSPLGEVCNEVPDRVSDAIVLIAAGYAAHGSVTLGWLAALSAVFVAYLRVFGRSLELPGDYSGPMAKQQRMFLITVACLMMALLPERWLPRIATSDDGVWLGPMWMALVLIVAGCAVTAIRRMYRIASRLNAAT